MKERSGAPEGEETGVRERLHGRPRKSFQLAFCECGYFQLVERLPREKVTARENCQSKVHGQRSEDLISHH